MPNIKIPTPLRPYTGGQSQVSIEGDTVGNALQALVEQYPDLRDQLFNGNDLRQFVNIYIDDEDVRFLDGMDTEIDNDENLRIIPTIAGG